MFLSTSEVLTRKQFLYFLCHFTPSHRVERLSANWEKIKLYLIVKTIEKDDKAKEPGACKDRSTFVMKVLLFVLSVVVVVQFVLFANNAASLKALKKDSTLWRKKRFWAQNF